MSKVTQMRGVLKIETERKEKEKKENLRVKPKGTFKTIPPKGYVLRHQRNDMGIIFNELSNEEITLNPCQRIN